MIEVEENYLRCREHLRENIQKFIDVFVDYYGEEARQEIEAKFNDVLYLAFIKPESISMYLSRIGDLISAEIKENALKDINTSLTAEDIFGGNLSFEYATIQPLNYFESFYNLYQLGPEGREEKFKNDYYDHLVHYLPDLTMDEYEEMIRTKIIPEKYQRIRSWLKDNLLYGMNLENADRNFNRAYEECVKLLHQINPDITKENFGYYIDDPEIQNLIKLADRYEDMKDEYQRRMFKYDKYKKQKEEIEKRRRELDRKYYLKFVEENLDLIPEEEREGFEKYKNDEFHSHSLGPRTRCIFDCFLRKNTPFDAFSSDACEFLENGKENTWKKNTIKSERVKYFKENGIDLGDDYEAYIDNEEAKKIWPSKERVDAFQASRNHIMNEYNIDFYSNMPEHLEARKEIEEKHFLDLEDSFNARIYVADKLQTFTNPNIIKTKDGYKVFSLLVVDVDRSAEQADHDIIHELNHILEMSISKVEGNHYELLSGWDVCTGEINQDSRQEVDTLAPEPPKREYELFSEIMNEVIALDIHSRFVKKGYHVFENPEKQNQKGFKTSYQHTLFIVKDFYLEFKKEILASRRNGNIQIIWDKVGKENFDALNELFHVFYENFEGYKIYGLLQSRAKGEVTEQTKVYDEICRRRDEILKKMRLHSMMNEEKPKKGRKKKEEDSTNKAK